MNVLKCPTVFAKDAHYNQNSLSEILYPMMQCVQIDLAFPVWVNILLEMLTVAYFTKNTRRCSVYTVQCSSIPFWTEKYGVLLDRTFSAGSSELVSHLIFNCLYILISTSLSINKYKRCPRKFQNNPVIRQNAALLRNLFKSKLTVSRRHVLNHIQHWTAFFKNKNII